MKTFNQLTVGDKIYTTATVKPLSMVINGIAQRPNYLLFSCTATNNVTFHINRCIRNKFKDKVSSDYTTTDYETAKRNCLKTLRDFNILKRKHRRI